MNLVKKNGGWARVRLDDVVEKREENDRENARSRFDTFVKGEHLDSESLHLRRLGSQQQEELPPSFYKIFRKGQILFMTRRPYLRKNALAHCDGICGEKMLTLQVKENVADPRLIPFLFHSSQFYDHTTGVMIGSTNPHCRWRDVAKYEFLLPPKDQQSNLAELLCAADRHLLNLREAEDAMLRLKRKISLEHYYDKSIRKVRLEELCEKIQDGSHFSPQKTYRANDGSLFRYVTSKNIRTSGLELSNTEYVDEEFHRSIYRRCDTTFGDVLLTKDGANTGTATINTLREEISLLSSVCLLRTDTSKMSNDYLVQYLNSDIGNANMIGKMTGTAIKRLTLRLIKNSKIPAPSLQLQEGIVSKLNSIDEGCRRTRKLQNASKNLLKSLINQIF